MSLYLFQIDGRASNLVRLIAFFFSGASAYLLRARIRLSGIWATALLVAWLGLLPWPSICLRIYALGVPYLILYAAFAPNQALLKFNRLGDYSYGTYIYAWPVQQVLTALSPGITPLMLFGASWVVTVALATLSWHRVEKPALSLKQSPTG